MDGKKGKWQMRQMYNLVALTYKSVLFGRTFTKDQDVQKVQLGLLILSKEMDSKGRS